MDTSSLVLVEATRISHSCLIVTPTSHFINFTFHIPCCHLFFFCKKKKLKKKRGESRKEKKKGASSLLQVVCRCLYSRQKNNVFPHLECKKYIP